MIRKIFRIWKSLGRYQWPSVYLVALTVVCAVFEGFSLALVLPILQALTLEETDSRIVAALTFVFGNRSNGQLAFLAMGLLVLMTILKNIVLICKDVFAVGLVNSMRNTWRESIFEGLLYGKGRLNETKKHGAILDTIINQTSGASKFVLIITELFSDMASATAMLAVIIVLSWKMTAFLVLIFCSIVFVINSPLKRHANRIGTLNTKLAQKISAVVSEAIVGLRHVKIFSVEAREFNLARDINTQQKRVMQNLTILSAMPTVTNETTISLLLFTGLGYFVFYSDIRFVDILPTLVLFLIVAQRLSAQITKFVSKLVTARTKLPSFRLVMETLATENACFADTHGISFAGLTQELRFRNVQFTYRNGSEVLRNFDFVLLKGSIVALIGESGTGKSTIADLILRLRSPDSGAICADGRDIGELDIVSWRAKIGYVSQEPFLFNTSIQDNILLGKPGASQQEVERAAVRAHAHDFIIGLPRGYETNVGERGGNLSGGQRQRIAIARALIRDPDLYIFDEPTSALDRDSGDMVRNTIRELARSGKTILLITHDLQTAKITSQVVDLSKFGTKEMRESASASSSSLNPISR